MKKYIEIGLVLFLLFLGSSYIRNFFMDVFNLLTNKKVTVIYTDEVVSEEIIDLKNEIKELNKLLELDHNLSEYKYISATVLTRDIDSWYDFIVLDKGIKDGIKEGMAVVNSNGLVGTIYSMGNGYSKVRLLTSNGYSNKMSVRIRHGEEYVYCILDSYNGRYVLKGVSDITEIKEGDVVTTSGLGNLPSGLILGYVDEIKYDSYELDKTVYVKPVEGIDNISYVSIVDKSI